MNHNPSEMQTPKATMALMNRVEKEFPTIKWENTCWHNDAMDSFETGNIQLRLPDGSGRGLLANRFRIWVRNPKEGFRKYAIAEITGKDEDTVVDYPTVATLLKGIKSTILPHLK